jgi:predicted ATPase/class 3 adenylate cyclase
VTALPVGIVTFLLTDIEASTRRWEQEPDAMRAAMSRHDVLFDHAVERHSGVIVKPRGEGDSRFAVFPRATDAVAAAAECQQAFAREDWPTESPILVRVAIHTGEADLRDGDYYGPTVNRCARLRSIAYGGQTLISLATAQLVRENLPAGVSLRDLGEHRLKDLSWPEHVFQLVVPGVPDEFPPLQSLDRHPTNLPIQATPFIGREREIEQVRDWIFDPSIRLVTLTGPGGSGKTRLALQVAANLVDRFPDGVFMVPLEAVLDPEFIVQSIAQVIGVRETSGSSLIDDINEFLRDKTMLLVFDNFDRLVSAGPRLTDLLAANPSLTILVTSRQRLHLRGERELSVPSMGLPDSENLPPLDRLNEFESIRLFVERAREVKPDFELDSENARAIVEICLRLDGLPLAIELAAARVRLFPPNALLKRLDRALPLLTGGARDLPARQQTLRDTIAWSHELLTEQEQTLFRRLSVFAGGFTLSAAAAVTVAAESDPSEPVGPDVDGAGDSHDPWLVSIEVLDNLEALVAKSLLRQVQITSMDGDDPRFSMLETIREFGLEQLDASGELGRVRRGHAEFFLLLATEAEPELDGPDQGMWLQRLDQEHGNLRAAMTCALDSGDAELGLRLTGTLWPFWEVRGYITEGRSWTERMLALGGEPEWRAKTLSGAGTMAWYQGDYESATKYHSEALDQYRLAGDERGVAFALSNLGVQFAQQDDYEQANQLFVDSLTRYRELDDHNGIAETLNNLGILATHHQNFERASELLLESLELAKRMGDKNGAAFALHNLGDNAYFQRDYEQASRHYLDSLRLHREIGSKVGAILSLGALASLAAATGDHERGAQLLGAVEKVISESDITLEQEEQARILETEKTLVEALGESMYRKSWEEGAQFSLDDAVSYTLSVVEPQTSRLG